MAAKAKVLVIDDDPDILNTTQLLLQKSGFDVLTAPGPEEGLRQLEDEEPDIVVLDIMMPHATEGLSWLLKVRHHPDPVLRDVPVIVVTSIHETTPIRLHSGDSDETGDYLPAQALFDKPVDPEKLAAKIEAILAHKIA